MSARVLLGLILCNLVWSANPAMAKLILADFPPATVAWLRYASALAAYLVLYPFLRSRFPRMRLFMTAAEGAFARRDLALAAILGFMTFCFAPLAQMEGLKVSYATENALIVAMEPLFTVFLAWLFLRERLSRLGLAAFAVALYGFTLLSGIPGPAGAASDWSAHRIGNLVLLASMLGEATYSIVGRKLLPRHDGSAIFGTGLVFGVLFLSIALAILAMLPASSSAALSVAIPLHWSWGSALGVVWLGPLGSTVTYFFWMTALTEAPVASLALTLFIQPVFGALWGLSFLGERLSPVQALGAAIILAAVAAPAFLHRATARAQA